MLLFRTEMAKFGLLVVGQPAAKNANAMLKYPKKPNKKTAPASTPKMVAVIKNGMTKQEMKESGEHWANHQGPYLTLAEVIAIETAKAETTRTSS